MWSVKVYKCLQCKYWVAVALALEALYDWAMHSTSVGFDPYPKGAGANAIAVLY